jgi:hypothetical protein
VQRCGAAGEGIHVRARSEQRAEDAVVASVEARREEQLPHEVTKCASKKSVFFSKIKNRLFCLFFRANLTVLGVLVGSAGE